MLRNWEAQLEVLKLLFAISGLGEVCAGFFRGDTGVRKQLRTKWCLLLLVEFSFGSCKTGSPETLGCVAFGVFKLREI